jgi:biopolymer transport protein ExbB/TolQ
MSAIVYYFTHPDAVIYTVATALLYPVLFIEVAALVVTVIEFGRFTLEMATRDRTRSLGRITIVARHAREHATAGRIPQAISSLEGIGRNWLVTHFVKELADGGDMSRSRILKLLADLELSASARLERTRMLIRFGPILGLMGTLIPISPALVGLAKGDVQTLSANLVVAFSTTVVGLLIGGLAFLMSVVRDRLYTRDVSDIEYALDMMGV